MNTLADFQEIQPGAVQILNLENTPGGPARTLQGELLFPVVHQLDAWHHKHAMWFPKMQAKLLGVSAEHGKQHVG